jgi:hypothetical protein
MTIENAFFDGGSSPPAASHLGLTPHDNSAAPLPRVDFRTLAVEHIARGFVVSATKPATKVGIWKWNSLNLLYTAQEVDDFLERNPKYAHSNVLVFCKCGMHYKRQDGKRFLECNLFVLDIDRAGVTKQILEDNPGKKIPNTYVVQSRPQSNKSKVHVYFRHTPYSIAEFTKIALRYAKKSTKEISGIRDRSLPKDERGYHPNRFDVKGSGKGGYVLGAGSVHGPEDGGEVYTILKDFPVADVPPWIVDWIVAVSSKEFDAREADTAARRAHAKRVNALDPAKRTKLQRQNDPDGFIISKEGTYLFLLYKARYFAEQGPSRKTLKAFLIDRAIDACHDGRAFVESEVGKRAIEHILDKVQIDTSESWLQREDLDDDEKTDVRSLTVVNSQQKTLMNIVEEFPDEISADDVYARLDLDKKSKADCELARRAMRACGFSAKNTGGKWMWTRALYMTTPHTSSRLTTPTPLHTLIG